MAKIINMMNWKLEDGAAGICGKSGFIVPYDELVMQPEYQGNDLFDTGVLVWNRFWSEPNPQGLIPDIPPDPEPLENPRPSPYWD